MCRVQTHIHMAATRGSGISSQAQTTSMLAMTARPARRCLHYSERASQSITATSDDFPFSPEQRAGHGRDGLREKMGRLP
ncbi:hypothetical protein ACCO45_003587 [Purpureocillium lilacinum]|uniref:Uncharacterized protein n=1 Tax=Purpureocillium lilacinum TaxID=33203 RepID=A0ACC4E1R0_PURLI